jgi:hypothetical protein
MEDDMKKWMVKAFIKKCFIVINFMIKKGIRISPKHDRGFLVKIFDSRCTAVIKEYTRVFWRISKIENEYY